MFHTTADRIAIVPRALPRSLRPLTGDCLSPINRNRAPLVVRATNARKHQNDYSAASFRTRIGKPIFTEYLQRCIFEPNRRLDSTSKPTPMKPRSSVMSASATDSRREVPVGGRDCRIRPRRAASTAAAGQCMRRRRAAEGRAGGRISGDDQCSGFTAGSAAIK